MAPYYDSDAMMGNHFDEGLTPTAFDDYELCTVPMTVPQLSLNTFMPASSYGDFSLRSPAFNNRLEEPFVPVEYRSTIFAGPRLPSDMDLASPYSPYARLPYCRQGSPFNTTSSSLSSSSNYSPKMPTRQSTFYGDAASFSTAFESTASFGELSLNRYQNPGVFAPPCIEPFELYQKPPATDVESTAATYHVPSGETEGSLMGPTYANDDAEYDIDDDDDNEAMIVVNPNVRRGPSPSDSDPDYIEPKRSPKRTRFQRNLGVENIHATTRSKVGKTYAPRRSSVGGRGSRAAASTSRHKHANSSSESNGDGPRPYSCPLEPYGCIATFRSKNEWKRHITTQHLAATYWDCDLCKDHATKPNLFNRRDLFTQHLRRMHHPLKDLLDAEGIETPKRKPKKSSSDAKNVKKARPLTTQEKEEDDEFEGKLQEHRVRCEGEKHTPPTKMVCAFCNQEFAGEKCCDDWMEHLGDHLIKATPDVNGHRPEWENDASLRAWLVEKELIVPIKGDKVAWMLKKEAQMDDEHTTEK